MSPACSEPLCQAILHRSLPLTMPEALLSVTGFACRPSREEDLHCVASLHASEAELRTRVARQDVQLTQMKAELLLREESYNKRFSNAGGRLSVNRAKGSHGEMMDWMLGGAEASVAKTGRRRAGNVRHAALT